MRDHFSPVRKAVIPVAGLGTRFLPTTRAVPKVLLPVLATPVIDYAVREAAASGITEIMFVMSRGMESVVEYFKPYAELESALEKREQDALLAQQKEIAALANISVRFQDDPRGLGHAVLLARDFVGDEPFAVILPDDVIWADTPATRQLIDVRNAHGGSVIAALEVADDVVEKKGIIDGDDLGGGVFRVRRLVEKPKLEDAPSNLSIIGRYVLEPAVFEYLAEEHTGAGGEIQLTDAIQATIGAHDVHACRFSGHHADTGNPGGMLEAALFEAGRDPALRQQVLDIVSRWD